MTLRVRARFAAFWRPNRRAMWGVCCSATLICIRSASLEAQAALPRSAPLKLRLVRDTVIATKTGAGFEATVEFVVYNNSQSVVYGTNECGRSPRFSVQRLAEGGVWREVFTADCYGGAEAPRPLRPSDSTTFVSKIVDFGGQRSQILPGRSAVFRFVYFVSLSQPTSELKPAISPSVVIRLR